MSGRDGRASLARLEDATGVPAVVLESPRGIADASIGAFGDMLARADCIVLLGKPLDFTVRWGASPAFDAAAHFIVVDSDAALVARAVRELGDRLHLGTAADTLAAARTLIERAAGLPSHHGDWRAAVRAAVAERPAAWIGALSAPGSGRLHPADVFRALAPVVARDPATILVCDGGEFAQWGQSLLTAPRRLINSVAGSIGSGLPFALASQLHDRHAPVFAVMGDGTFGFHMAEIETAARLGLPIVVIVGNDARWNAESQIQRRLYGADRMHNCDMLPARYDLAAIALGGHGELVTTMAELRDAIQRSIAGTKPAVINIMIEPAAAPVIRRQA